MKNSTIFHFLLNLLNKIFFGFFVSDGNCDLHISRRTTNAHSRRFGEMLVPGIIWHVSFWKNLRRLLKYITVNPESFVSIGYFFPSQKNPRKDRFFEASKAGSPVKSPWNTLAGNNNCNTVLSRVHWHLGLKQIATIFHTRKCVL